MKPVRKFKDTGMTTADLLVVAGVMRSIHVCGKQLKVKW